MVVNVVVVDVVQDVLVRDVEILGLCSLGSLTRN